MSEDEVMYLCVLATLPIKLARESIMLGLCPNEGLASAALALDH
jgi:hypothetical protein